MTTNFKTFLEEVDNMWTLIKNDLDEDVLKDPKLVKAVKIMASVIITHDRQDPLKTIRRMSHGSKSKAINIAYDICKNHYGLELSKEDFEYVFDHVCAAADGGTEVEWDSE